MRVIGLTGGVGSGKSYVAQCLQRYYGMELLIADELGHVALEPGTDSYREIVARFGTDVVAADGTLDRGRLADLIFHDPVAMADLNAIVHPVVRTYIAEYLEKRRGLPGTVLLENAILYETDCDALCDEVWYVAVPAKIRVQRLMQNRGYTAEKAEAVMASQHTDAFFRERADRVIDNAGGRRELQNRLKSMIPFQERQV